MRTQSRWTFAFFTALFLLAACGKDEGANRTQPVISDLNSLTQASDRKNMVGRRVRFTGVRASQVVGDYIFWAGERGNELPIVLEGELRGTQPEGAVQIRSGRTYDIVGVVRFVENAAAGDRMWRLIDDQERAAIRAATIYIGADTVSASGNAVALELE